MMDYQGKSMDGYYNNKERWIVADFIVLVILLFTGMTSSTATILATSILCLSYILRNPSSIVGSILFFYPFYCIFKLSGSGTSLYNFVIIFAIYGILKSNQSKVVINFGRKVRELAVLLFIFSCYLLLVGFVNSRIDLLTIILDLFVPFLLVIAVIQKIDEIDIYRAIIMFSIGVIISGLVGAEIIPVNGLYDYISVVHYKAAGIRLVRCQGLTVNPNYFSIDVNLGIASLLVLPVIQGKKRNIHNYVLIVMQLVIGIMTISKSFFVGLAVTILLFLFFNRNPNSFLKQILVLAFCIGGFVAIIAISESQYISALFDRFSIADNTESLTSGRTVIWFNYLKYMIKDPVKMFLGWGVGATHPEDFGASHSFYIECLYYFGVFGFVLFAYILKRVFCWKINNRFSLIPIAVFAVRAVAINLVLREAFSIDIIIMILIMYIGCKRQAVQNYLFLKDEEERCYEKI